MGYREKGLVNVKSGYKLTNNQQCMHVHRVNNFVANRVCYLLFPENLYISQLKIRQHRVCIFSTFVKGAIYLYGKGIAISLALHNNFN